jgi:hypothetical protein
MASRQAQAEIAVLLQEMERRKGVSVTPASLFTPKQRKAFEDSTRRRALLCGRRAGKTIGEALELGQTMMDYPGDSFIFFEKTGEGAYRKIGRPFMQRVKDHGWPFKEWGRKEIRCDNGAILYLLGAHDWDDLDKARGLERVRRAYVDECGTQKPANLEYLVNDVLDPALGDTDGELTLSGTPGRALMGYWYEVTNGMRPGWSTHRWTIADNPHLPGAERLARILAENKWAEDNPIYLREWLGRWVRDESALVFAFDPRRNVIPQRPELGKGWTTVLAIDFGIVHSVAWVILAFGPYGRTVYVLHSESKAGLSVTETAEKTQEIIATWQPDEIVGDLGGMGKAFGVEFAKHWGITVIPADKRDKRTALEYTSDALRTGQLLSHEDNEGLHRELDSLQWDDRHEDIADGQDDHEAEALVYGYRRCPAYANREEPASRENDGLPPWVDREDDEPETVQQHYGEVEDW